MSLFLGEYLKVRCRLSGGARLRAAALAASSQDVVFSVPRCVSPHISTRVYQSFYHLAAAASPSGKRKQDAARSHTNTCRGPGRWVVAGVNDLSRSRIRPRL